VDTAVRAKTHHAPQDSRPGQVQFFRFFDNLLVQRPSLVRISLANKNPQQQPFFK
jgi:hypothetical protein